MEKKYYRVYGLSVESEFLMPELPKTEEQHEVSIRYGKVPLHIESPLKTGAAFELTNDKFLLHVKNIASFLVEKGKEVIIDVKEGVPNYEVQVFLLGSVFGALLHQRELLPIHASTVCMQGHNILICGLSGVGKSSLAATLFKRGHKILNDDISVIEIKEDVAVVHPGFPFMKLWQDTMEKLQISIEGKRRIRKQLKKYSVPLGNLFESNFQVPDIIINLKTHNKSDFEIKEIKGLDKYLVLRPNVYRKAFLVGREKEKRIFHQLGQLANQVRLFELKRPQISSDTKNLINKLEEILL